MLHTGKARKVALFFMVHVLCLFVLQLQHILDEWQKYRKIMKISWYQVMACSKIPGAKGINEVHTVQHTSTEMIQKYLNLAFLIFLFLTLGQGHSSWTSIILN